MSTSAPRATLTSQASSRIASSSAAPTRWRVPAVAGAASTTKSARGQISSSRETGIVPSRPRRVTARTSARSGSSSSISARPIPPAPTIATVAPSSPPDGGRVQVLARRNGPS